MEDHNPTSPPSPLSWQPLDGNPIVLRKGEHPISRRTIDPDVFKIINRLADHGFTAYLVGGAVRDLMLGRTPVDFDLVTDARPGQIKKLFSNAYLIGRRFRLAHIHFRGGKYIEVATFRKEQEPVLEPEARPAAPASETAAAAPRPAPAPGTNPHHLPFHDIYGSPAEDAHRRDITINALFFDVISSSVIDYVGGLEDLRRRVIRVIGEPAERFAEDPVRIWRVVRHAARLGFEIDEPTGQMIPVLKHLVAKCPGARLYEELNNDMESRTQPVFEALRRHGLLRHILGRLGEDIEADGELFARIDRLLGLKDEAHTAGLELGREDTYSLLFMPWVERLLVGAEGDIPKMLKDAILGARFQASVPRSLRANVIQILTIAEHLRGALRTGRMKWALKRRPDFAPAFRVCLMVERGRPPHPGETFDDLYREAFPAGFSPRPRKHRGSRRRRR
jgi:poly(A) polymerase